MDESKRKVPFSKGQALADEFGIRFFETSAKTNSNVDEVQPPTPLTVSDWSRMVTCKPLPLDDGRGVKREQ